MSASLSMLETEVQNHAGYQIFPVPEPVVDANGATAAVGESFVQDEAAYAQDAFYPAGCGAAGFNLHLPRTGKTAGGVLPD